MLHYSCYFFNHSRNINSYGLLGVPPHAHQLKDCHYPQVSKNVILSKKLARKDDVFYESFDSR
ncbi:hypothetical protein BK763_31655 [Bacillus thuringiensis serovar thompsoni]|nr:hypothetical protein BK763_31655 [Bacillus thuringiensis serovar thompsoni]